jgi:hypothetical protein
MINNYLKRAEALGSHAEFTEKDVVCYCEHFELFDHVVEIHRGVDFLFARCLYFFNRHSFPMGEDELQK